jgi:hypothetical protein
MAVDKDLNRILVRKAKELAHHSTKAGKLQKEAVKRKVSGKSRFLSPTYSSTRKEPKKQDDKNTDHRDLHPPRPRSFATTAYAKRKTHLDSWIQDFDMNEDYVSTIAPDRETIYGRDSTGELNGTFVVQPPAPANHDLINQSSLNAQIQQIDEQTSSSFQSDPEIGEAAGLDPVTYIRKST